MNTKFEQAVDDFIQHLTPEYLEKETWNLLRTFPDKDGGIDGYRLVRHLLKDPNLDDIQTGWAYLQFRPVFRNLFDQIPSLYYFTGD